MRKFKLFALASLVAGSLNAQYFQHVYGNGTRDYLESGVNTSPVLPQGHIMTGYTDYPGINSLMVTATDLDGRFAGGLFNNYYNIIDANTGAIMEAKGRRVLQPNALGGRILVWGDYTDNPGAFASDKFFFTVINPNGVAGAILGYALPFTVVEAEATSMYFSATQPNTVFVCGFVRQQPGAPRLPVVMSLNSGNGAMNWSWIFNGPNGYDMAPMDIVESPYPNSTGTVDLALAGHFTRAGFFETGFLWRIPMGPAFPFAPLNAGFLVEYGTPGSNPGAFEAIDIANNPGNIGQPGFVLGGYYNNPNSGTDDMWALKTDPTGTIIDFSTVIDYSTGGTREYGFDIIERKNTFPPPMNYEYYIGGYVDNGVWGGEDAVVYKLDFTGIPWFPGPQFTYGGGGNERFLQLDQYNIYGPNNDGLSGYGVTDGSWPLLGGPDFYLAKAYFNGVQTPTCNYDLQDPPYWQGPQIAEWWQPRFVNRLKKTPLVVNDLPMQDWEICWAPNDPFGSNARIAAETSNTLSQPGFFPNPVSRENGLVTVTFGKQVAAGVAQVELRNSLGQLVWSKQVSIAEGQSSMQLELGNMLNAGMYHLSVSQDGTLNNYRILVE